MFVWGNFSLTFQSLKSNKCGDVGHVVIWSNIQWVICSDNFYEQEKNPSSNACLTFWPLSVVHLPPGRTTCFLLWCSICSTWGRNDYSGMQPLVSSFQMCAPDGYPENPPHTQISCLALTGWIQAETQSSAVLSSSLAGSIHGELQAKHNPLKTTLYLFLTHRKH